jgi:GNAT superfamily N-acetyltransferase
MERQKKDTKELFVQKEKVASQYYFRIATEEDKQLVLCLYNQVKHQKYSVWNGDYPGLFEIEEDIKRSNLFLFYQESTLLGAISICEPREMDKDSRWKATPSPCEIARVVIERSQQGKKLSEKMVESFFPVLKERGYLMVRLSSAIINIPACKAYFSLGFHLVGKTRMYHHWYYLFEKEVNHE